MRGVWSVESIRSAEAAVIAEVGEAAIMARAAFPLAVHCGQQLGRVYGSRVVLLVGAGNNGGDALYAGVSLLSRGAVVHAVLLAPERAHSAGLIAFVTAGGQVAGVTAGTGEAIALLDRADLVVDGITGIGGRGALRPPADELVAAIGCPVVAVDLASGIDADTAAVAGAAVRADTTVIFGGLKVGAVVGAGAARSGALSLVDIGLGPHLGPPLAHVLDRADVAAALPVPRPTDDKYGQGVVGVVAGSATYPGAAVLCVGGALHGKAGLVRYAGAAADGVRARWPEVIVTDGVPTAAGRVQCWVIGPGIGTDDAAQELVRQVLGTDVPVLVDADGLAVLAAEPELVRRRAAPTVLTPHDREFARIFGPPGDDRLGATRAAAAAIGATVLLKGQATIVAGPDGRVFVNPTGSGWLATAGSGDVLSGLAGALLSAGGDPTRMAAVAAYVHGLAGSIAGGDAPGPAVPHGAPAPAMDIALAIPAAIRSLRTGG